MIFVCQLTKEKCRRVPPCEPHHPCWLSQRFAKLLSQLSEPSSVTAAVTALNGLLTAEKLSFSDIANVLEQQRYSTEDMQHALNKGKELASREIAAQDPELEFFDGDQPNWFAITTFNRDNIGQLRSAWEKEFTADIVGKVLGRPPSHKQAQCILRIFIKLGGRCGPDIETRYF